MKRGWLVSVMMVVLMCGAVWAEEAPPPREEATGGALTPIEVEEESVEPAPVEDAAEAEPSLAERLLQLSRRLDALLTPAGLPLEPQAMEQVHQLQQIAQESNVLAQQARAHDERLGSNQLQMRAHYALARQAQMSEAVREAAYHLNRLRTAALSNRDADGPDAEVLSDFWLMQADLFEISQAQLSVVQRQRAAIRRLEQFLRDQSPHGDEAVEALRPTIVLDVKRSLLRLYDQLGMSEELCAVIAALGEDEASAALREAYGYCKTIGQTFTARLPLDDERDWSSSDHRGQWVLLHFWSDDLSAEMQGFDALRVAYDQYASRGLTMLSINMAEAGDAMGAPPVDWPMTASPVVQTQLGEVFAIRSVPRFVLIDPQGRVTAVAGSTALLQRIETLLNQRDH